MRGMKVACAAIAGVCLVSATPGSAQSQTLSSFEAEQIRKLEIMLMVSSLRCRSGESDLRPEYRAFSTRHVGSLKAASRKLRADLAAKHGTKASLRALDRISTGMANTYGGGHPWQECSDLKEVAGRLSQSENRVELIATANYLLAPQRPGNFAVVAAP